MTTAAMGGDRTNSIAYTIKRTLRLDDQRYTDFYALVEDTFTASRSAKTRFSTIKGKNHVKVELFSAVLKRCDGNPMFPETARLLQTDEGRAAFQKLVYRINANLKRRGGRERRRAPTGDAAAASGSAATVTSDVRSEHQDSEGGAYQQEEETGFHCPARKQQISAVDLVWVTFKNGDYKAVCHTADIAREDIPRTAFYSPDQLLLSRLETLLYTKYGFDQRVDHLKLDQEHDRPAVVDSQGDWEILISFRCRQEKLLKFIVV
jgi:hypothetical protein